MTGTLPLFDKLGIGLDPELWELALVHRSFAFENGGIPTNERLEFLGDAVLGVVVTSHLYRVFPDLPEGQLARLRAAVVNTQSLASVARELQVGDLIKLGHGELTTNGRDKSSILADTMEAIIGATFLSAGMAGAETLVHRLLDARIVAAATMGAGLDWKTSLQEVCAFQGWPMPAYEIESTGPDHDRRFTAWCLVHTERFGPGTGRSKKEAEQVAAGNAYGQLKALGLTTPASEDVAAPAPPA